MRDNGWLYLELTTEVYFNAIKATEVYFNAIKATEVLSRCSTIGKVELGRSLLDLPPPTPPTWVISDTSIAAFKLKNDGTAVIIGIGICKTTVYFDNVSCKIKVE